MKPNIIKSLIVFPVFAAACFTVSARADEPKHEEPKHEQEESLTDNRMRVLYYDANDVYTILTRVGYESYIEFGAHEDVETISVGERSFWQLIPSGNRLFIRPLRNDVATNMTVITNKHAYQFDLKSVSDEKTNILYVARFSYPEDERLKMRALQQARIANPFMPNAALQAQINPATAMTLPPQPPINAAPVAPPSQQEPPIAPPSMELPPKSEAKFDADTQKQPPVAPPSMELPPTPPHQEAAVAPPRLAEIPPPEKRNYSYTFSGPENSSPYEVFDDGMTTYFRYNPPALMAPEVGMLEKDGTETAVTVYQNGAYFAVDVVAPKLLLHTQTGTAYIFNETSATHP